MNKFACLLACLVCLVSHVQAASVEQDVDQYIQYLRADSTGGLLESLAWVGLNDTRLFDQIEQRILAEAAGVAGNKAAAKRIGHYLRALGFSGNPKYLPTLTQFSHDPAYDNYARRALADQPLYQRWNPVIANRATFNPKRSDDVNRFMNMLSSDDLLLYRLACKRIYSGTRDEALYDMLEKHLRSYYMRADLSGEYADSVAWLAKALGSSRMQKYQPLLTEVAENAPNQDVVRHTRRSLERDFGVR